MGRKSTGKTITGTPEADTLDGGGKADLITGLGGADTITGGNGEDTLYGGSGGDLLDGELGRDLVFGGAGSDYLVSGPDGSLDLLDGGGGEDLIEVASGTRVEVRAGGGNDHVLLSLGALAATLDGGSGEDLLDLRFMYPDKPKAVTLDLGAGTLTVGNRDLGPVTGFERVDFHGSDKGDRITTLGGDDTIYAAGGANVVLAGGGNDDVHFELGRAGTYDGGSGTDRLWIDNPSDAALTFDASSGSDGFGSTLGSFEAFVVYGSDRGDGIVLGKGHDAAYGGDGDDVLTGLAGDDNLSGGKGRDTLEGGAGRDRLVGADGEDRLTGGEGADVFAFVPDTFQTDRVTDFEAGVDTISIDRGITDQALPEGSVAPSRLSFGMASGSQGQFVLTDLGDSDLLVWDSNGAAAGGVFEIALLSGESGLTASDLLIA